MTYQALELIRGRMDCSYTSGRTSSVILQEGLPQLGLGEVVSGGLKLGSLPPLREPQEDTFGVRAAQRQGANHVLPPQLSLTQPTSG